MAGKCTTVVGNLKRCAKCGEYKVFADFPKSRRTEKTGWHGLQAYCRPCGLAKNREWRENNPAASKEIARRAYWKNPEKQRAAGRNLTDEQRLAKNARARLYRKANPEKVAMWNRLRRHKERASGKLPDRWDIGWLMCSQDARCVYCGELFVGQKFQLDHKTPVSRGGRNDLDNIHLVCPTCNMKKSSKTHDEYSRQLEATA